jgi:hypothetical protein
MLSLEESVDRIEIYKIPLWPPAHSLDSRRDRVSGVQVRRPAYPQNRSVTLVIHVFRTFHLISFIHSLYRWACGPMKSFALKLLCSVNTASIIPTKYID